MNKKLQLVTILSALSSQAFALDWNSQCQILSERYGNVQLRYDFRFNLFAGNNTRYAAAVILGNDTDIRFRITDNQNQQVMTFIGQETATGEIESRILEYPGEKEVMVLKCRK